MTNDWFNPLAWLMARRMVAERERACDDIVLRHGAKPADYAEQVLEISAGLSTGWLAGCSGVAMVRASNLEGRLRAILDSRRNRAALTRAAVVSALIALAAIIVPVAMMKAAPAGEGAGALASSPDDTSKEAMGSAVSRSTLVAAGEIVSEPVKVPAGQPDAAGWRFEARSESSDPAAAGWGEPVEGLSVRLSSEKPIWDFRQQGFFKFSVRNQGKQTVAVWRTQAAGELEVDGIWHRWFQPVDAKTSPLAPGGQFDDLALSIGGGWRNDARFLSLGVGKHTLRFAVSAQPENGGPKIRAVSNPIEVEFRWAANATSPPVTFVPADLPVIAEIGGSVVDDETGARVTDFWVQEGMADPEKPKDIIWGESFRGPTLSGPQKGNFAVQGRKPGQAWRVLAGGYLPQMVLEHPLAGAIRTSSLVVRLRRGGEIHATVLDYKGQPVAGAQVTIHRANRTIYGSATPHQDIGDTTATTGAAGRFVLSGVDGTVQNVVVTSADGQQVQPALQSASGQEMKITLHQPATLIVHYDIPGDKDEAALRLSLQTWDKEMPLWNGVAAALEASVANRGQIVLTNLTPGTYDFCRSQNIPMSAGGGGAIYERRTIVIDSGQTQRVDMVRTTGWRVRGQITGLDHIKVRRASLQVRAAGATGDPRNMMELMLPCYDALAYPGDFGEDGNFQTALLEPGNYTFIVDVYEPERPETAFRTGLRLPSYVGTAKVTVTAASEPPPLKIELHPTAPGGTKPPPAPAQAPAQAPGPAPPSGPPARGAFRARIPMASATAESSVLAALPAKNARTGRPRSYARPEQLPVQVVDRI